MMIFNVGKSNRFVAKTKLDQSHNGLLPVAFEHDQLIPHFPKTVWQLFIGYFQYLTNLIEQIVLDPKNEICLRFDAKNCEKCGLTAPIAVWGGRTG
ncbi:MAG: hypothetical protein ABI686_00875 [Acidobacteriota bacterium]